MQEGKDYCKAFV